MKITRDRLKSSIYVALLVFLLMAISFLSPLGFSSVTSFVNAAANNANTAAGLLNSLMTGNSSGLQNMMILMTVAQMSTQTFQSMGGGGSTPQTGPAEEQTARSGNIIPTRTGYDDSGNASSYSGMASQSIFLAGTGSDQSLAPSTLTITSGSGFNFFNTSDSNQQIRIYKDGEAGAQIDQTVASGYYQVYNFNTAGTYRLCLVNSGAESCNTTINVQ